MTLDASFNFLALRLSWNVCCYPRHWFCSWSPAIVSGFESGIYTTRAKSEGYHYRFEACWFRYGGVWGLPYGGYRFNNKLNGEGVRWMLVDTIYFLIEIGCLGATPLCNYYVVWEAPFQIYLNATKREKTGVWLLLEALLSLLEHLTIQPSVPWRLEAISHIYSARNSAHPQSSHTLLKSLSILSL